MTSGHQYQMGRVPHLRELAAEWREEAERPAADRAFCLSMAQAQDDAAEAILAGPEAREALLARRCAEHQAAVAR